MTHAGISCSLGRRTLAAAAALTLAGLVVPAPTAHAAGEMLSAPDGPQVAGQLFTVTAEGLTAGTSYRVALTGTSNADTTDRAESNTCATAAAASGNSLTCTVTENTPGSYDLKLLDANGIILDNDSVTLAPSVTVTQPIATDRPGTDNDTITLTYTPGIVWSVPTVTNGTVTLPNSTTPITPTTQIFDPSTAKAGDTIDLEVATTAGQSAADVSVKATAAEGYGIPGGDPTHTLRVTSAASVPAPLSIPSASQPVKVDPVGLANDAVTLTNIEGVNWFIGDTAVTFAEGETSKTVKVTPDAETKNVTVYARAADGRAFSGGRLAEEFVLTYTDTRAEPAATRVAGVDRIGTSVEISKKYYDASTDTVYVANGWRYADALTAGPAAARDNAPLLLTEPDTLNQAVADEIRRLTPSTIKIVGGTDVVNAEVESALGALGQATVQRLAGDDRIDTAIAVSRQWANADTAYVAYGWDLPDALSGGAGAAKQDAPLLLSMSDDLTDETISRLRAMGVQTIKLVGGTKVLNSTVANQADSIGDIARYAGNDRYGTSAEVIKNVTGSTATPVPTRAFLATGVNFPDALAGIPAADKVNAPLALVAPTCTPVSVKTELDKLALTEVMRLGGADVLSDFPMSANCGW